MRFFSTKNGSGGKPTGDEKLIQMLKRSEQGFRFDPEQLKIRVMQSVRSTEQIAAPRHFISISILRYSMITAGLVIFTSGTLVYASAQSGPGDKLFGITKLKEQVILSLTFNNESKAEYYNTIVTHRLEALEALETQIKSTEARANTKKLQTIKESDESISEAIESVSMSQQTFMRNGRSDDSRRLLDQLTRLEKLAAEHEKRMEAMELETVDEKTRVEIYEHRIKVKESRVKAWNRINLPDDEKSSD